MKPFLTKLNDPWWLLCKTYLSFIDCHSGLMQLLNIELLAAARKIYIAL